MSASLLALAGTLGFGATLAWIMLAATPLARWPRALWAAAWATPLGFGTLSLIVFAWRLAGLARPTPWALAAVGTLALAVVTVAARRVRSAVPAPIPPPAPRRPGLPRPLACLAWLALAVSLAGAGLGFAALTRHEEIGSWDAVAVWNVRARQLDRGWEQFPALLAQVERSSHPNYPLGLPATIAGLRLAAGAESAATPVLVAAAWATTALLLLFLAVQSVAAPPVAALATAWLAVTPLTVYWAAAQVGDVPVAVLLLGALTALASRLPGWPGVRLPAAFAGACLGLLPWTKNEGLPVALLVGGCFLVAHRLARRRRRRDDAESDATPLAATVLLASAAPGCGATVVFKLAWSPGSGLETYLQGAWAARLLDPQRWWLPARELGSRLLASSADSWWNLVWIVPAAAWFLALALGAGRRPAFAFAGAALAAVVASWLPIYAATPYPLAWHVASSLDRLMLQVLPAALALGVTALAVGVDGVRPGGRDRFGA